MKNIYQYNLKKINGQPSSLNEFEGKVLLIVNVASKCGLTPQYEGLTKLQSQYQDRGFSVLGFPANEFLAQEPGTNAEIQDFCNINYNVNFPLFEKIIVKGEGQHPLYQYLTETKKEAVNKKDGNLLKRLSEKGLLTGKENDIKWNFEKFLINAHGEVVERFAPDIDPMDPAIQEALERELAKS
jgi:glutathione peroxidase